MSTADSRLLFERPIAEFDKRIARLGTGENASPEVRDEMRALRRERNALVRTVYSNLEPWETVQVARHPERPKTCDYIDLVFDDFVELHGDRFFGDDRAIRTGFAKLGEQRVMVVGHEKGNDYKERITCNYGSAHPEGYRKAMAKMRLAAKFGVPIIALIDTPGAFPGIGAEERGQATVIAESMFAMSRLPTPIVCVVIGEGGSGGALGIGVGDRVAMLQHAYYSVISPEGCAGILWKSGAYAEQAAKALRFTSKDLPGFGIVDDVIEEPLGGAHRDHYQIAASMQQYLARTLRTLLRQPIDELLENRYQKFRKMGQYLERLDGEDATVDEADSQPSAETPSQASTTS
jgi:acetyl-CoA carboxylase carboxyl transferase subunit alpha